MHNVFIEGKAEVNFFFFFLENFHLIHHPIPFQGVDVRIVSNFRGSPHPI